MAELDQIGVEFPEPRAAARILVVDDEVRILNLVARALRAEGFAADVAADGAKAIELATGSGYDLVILDLLMPGTGGVDVLQELIARRPQQRVLVLSALGDVDSKVTVLNLGADDYLARPFSLDELLARVRARLRPGRRLDDPELADHYRQPTAPRLALDAIRQEADAGFGPVRLSRTECLLLRELIRNAGRTVSKERLLSSVWGFSHDPGSNVVDVYVRRLRAKLGDDIIATVRGEGYRVCRLKDPQWPFRDGFFDILWAVFAGARARSS
jgi:DNA-binding response OmpR family regulator